MRGAKVDANRQGREIERIEVSQWEMDCLIAEVGGVFSAVTNRIEPNISEPGECVAHGIKIVVVEGES